MFGGMGWWLAAVLALYTGQTLRNLYQLDRMLEGHRRPAIFDTRGLWPEIFARVELSDSTFSTLTASRVTSIPIPSPGMTAIRFCSTVVSL